MNRKSGTLILANLDSSDDIRIARPATDRESVVANIGLSRMTPPRILLVAMQHSIHLARWVSLLEYTGWDLCMCSLSINGPRIHSDTVSARLDTMSFGPRS